MVCASAKCDERSSVAAARKDALNILDDPMCEIRQSRAVTGLDATIVAELLLMLD
jgi:hypothetical protein